MLVQGCVRDPMICAVFFQKWWVAHIPRRAKTMPRPTRTAAARTAAARTTTATSKGGAAQVKPTTIPNRLDRARTMPTRPASNTAARHGGDTAGGGAAATAKPPPRGNLATTRRVKSATTQQRATHATTPARLQATGPTATRRVTRKCARTRTSSTSTDHDTTT